MVTDRGNPWNPRNPWLIGFLGSGFAALCSPVSVLYLCALPVFAVYLAFRSFRVIRVFSGSFDLPFADCALPVFAFRPFPFVRICFGFRISRSAGLRPSCLYVLLRLPPLSRSSHISRFLRPVFPVAALPALCLCGLLGLPFWLPLRRAVLQCSNLLAARDEIFCCLNAPTLQRSNRLGCAFAALCFIGVVSSPSPVTSLRAVAFGTSETSQETCSSVPPSAPQGSARLPRRRQGFQCKIHSRLPF